MTAVPVLGRGIAANDEFLDDITHPYQKQEGTHSRSAGRSLYRLSPRTMPHLIDFRNLCNIEWQPGSSAMDEIASHAVGNHRIL